MVSTRAGGEEGHSFKRFYCSLLVQCSIYFIIPLTISEIRSDRIIIVFQVYRKWCILGEHDHPPPRCHYVNIQYLRTCLVRSNRVWIPPLLSTKQLTKIFHIELMRHQYVCKSCIFSKKMQSEQNIENEKQTCKHA